MWKHNWNTRVVFRQVQQGTGSATIRIQMMQTVIWEAASSESGLSPDLYVTVFA